MTQRKDLNYAAAGKRHASDLALVKRAKSEGRCVTCRTRPARECRRECVFCSTGRALRDHLRHRYGVSLAVIRSTNLTPAPGRQNADS